MRKFETGATRNDDSSKVDYEGVLSPLSLECYARYVNGHRLQADGKLRASDNWQLGIPKAEYLKSAFRHFISVWKIHRGYKCDETLEDSLCGVLFNIMGYLHEAVKNKTPKERKTTCQKKHLIRSRKRFTRMP